MRSQREDSNTTRIAILETIAYQTNETLKRFEQRFDNLERSIELFKKEMKEDISEVRKESRSYFLWMMGTLFVLFGSPAVTEIVKLFHRG